MYYSNVITTILHIFFFFFLPCCTWIFRFGTPARFFAQSGGSYRTVAMPVGAVLFVSISVCVEKHAEFLLLLHVNHTAQRLSLFVRLSMTCIKNISVTGASQLARATIQKLMPAGTLQIKCHLNSFIICVFSSI